MTVVAILSVAPSSLGAEAPPKQGVELRLVSILAPNLAADYERWLSGRISVQGGMGLRRSAMGDYSGTAFTTSLGARYWLHRSGPSWMRAPLGGAFAETSLNAQRTSVYDKVDNESLPSTYTFATSLALGYRIVIKERATVTGTASVPFRVDVPRGPARADYRANIGFGLRAGVLF